MILTASLDAGVIICPTNVDFSFKSFQSASLVNDLSFSQFDELSPYREDKLSVSSMFLYFCVSSFRESCLSCTFHVDLYKFWWNP